MAEHSTPDDLIRWASSDPKHAQFIMDLIAAFQNPAGSDEDVRKFMEWLDHYNQRREAGEDITPWDG